MSMIKLMSLHGYYDSYDEYNTDIGSNLSDWEEVTNEELDFLKQYKYKFQSIFGTDFIIVEKDSVSVSERIQSLKQFIADEQDKELKKKQEAEKKRQETAEKRAMAKLEKDRKALAKLIEQNPDLVKLVIEGK